ncbi:hypothetical protein ACWDYJ_22305, partial [Streptomyces sp. NPDC003042]
RICAPASTVAGTTGLPPVPLNRAVPGVSVRVVMQTGCGPYAYIVVDFEPPGESGETEPGTGP